VNEELGSKIHSFHLAIRQELFVSQNNDWCQSLNFIHAWGLYRHTVCFFLVLKLDVKFCRIV